MTVKAQQIVDLPASLDVFIKGARTAPSLVGSLMLGPDARGTQVYLPASITVRDPLNPVTSSVIKRMPLHRIVVGGLKASLLAELGSDSVLERAAVKAYLSDKPGRKVAAAIAERPTPQHLQDAALVYYIARSLRDTSVRAVERSFGLTYPQAHSWVRRIKAEHLA